MCSTVHILETPETGERYYIDSINNEAFFRPEDYIHYCEHAYSSALHKIASTIVKSDCYNMVMFSGPSSSGKTTSANKLSRIIGRSGHNAHVVHLDDFYRNRDETQPGPDGKPDFEDISALNLDLLSSVLTSLSKNGTASLPFFDFIHGVRIDNMSKIVLDPGDVVIVEGLHALNPVIDGYLPNDRLFRIFVDIHSQIYSKTHEVLFSCKELRFIRRLVRDYNYRNSTAENTFEMWPNVLKGEEKNLFPYEDRADYVLDTLHPYEICVFKEKARSLLAQIGTESPYYSKAHLLFENLDQVEPLDKRLVPRSSLLNEFITRTE